MPPTCFGHTCRRPQGGALQRMYYKILNHCSNVRYCCRNIYGHIIYNIIYPLTFMCLCWFRSHIELLYYICLFIYLLTYVLSCFIRLQLHYVVLFRTHYYVHKRTTRARLQYMRNGHHRIPLPCKMQPDACTSGGIAPVILSRCSRWR